MKGYWEIEEGPMLEELTLALIMRLEKRSRGVRLVLRAWTEDRTRKEVQLRVDGLEAQGDSWRIVLRFPEPKDSQSPRVRLVGSYDPHTQTGRCTVEELPAPLPPPPPVTFLTGAEVGHG